MRLFFLFLTLFFINGYAQNIKKGTFFLDANYGLNGNFFVKSYDESNRVITDTIFLKKNFIGSNLGLGFGFYFNKNWKLSFGYTRQENKRDIDFNKQYGNVEVTIQSTIRHFNNFWNLDLTRYFEKNKQRFGVTLGASYMRFRQNEIDIQRGGRSVNILERDAKRNGLEDLGIVLGTSYDFKIQPKVYFGVSSRFHYNLTANIAESISLSPYVHFFF